MKFTKNPHLMTLCMLLVCSCSFNGNSNSKTIASLGDSVDGDTLELVETKEDGVISIVSSQMENYEEVVADAAPEATEEKKEDSAE